MSDLLRAMAFAFRRKGAEAMPGAELRLLLAYDLRWFAPEDAKKAVARAVEGGLVAQDAEGVLSPLFDPSAVDIPVNFRPDARVFDEELPASLPQPRAAAPKPPAPPLPVAAEPEEDEEIERLALEERRRRGNLLSLDVARLVVARRAGQDVSGRLAEAEARVLRA